MKIIFLFGLSNQTYLSRRLFCLLTLHSKIYYFSRDHSAQSHLLSGTLQAPFEVYYYDYWYFGNAYQAFMFDCAFWPGHASLGRTLAWGHLLRTWVTFLLFLETCVYQTLLYELFISRQLGPVIYNLRNALDLHLIVLSVPLHFWQFLKSLRAGVLTRLALSSGKCRRPISFHLLLSISQGLRDGLPFVISSDCYSIALRGAFTRVGCVINDHGLFHVDLKLNGSGRTRRVCWHRPILWGDLYDKWHPFTALRSLEQVPKLAFTNQLFQDTFILRFFLRVIGFLLSLSFLEWQLRWCFWGYLSPSLETLATSYLALVSEYNPAPSGSSRPLPPDTAIASTWSGLEPDCTTFLGLAVEPLLPLALPETSPERRQRPFEGVVNKWLEL